MDFDKFFGEVPDFRLNRRKKHRLVDILAISVCAVVCGANDFEEIATYGRQKIGFLGSFLALPNGIPSHDTFNRVFRFLDKERFSESLHRWSKQILSCLEKELTHISVDGKVLCGTAKAGHKKSGICLVSAWVAEHRLVLGQAKVDSKSNEKTAIPELLGSLDLSDSLVSIDAIACRQKNADLIVNKGGNYLLALKGNNKQIHEQVRERMQRICSQLPCSEHIDFGSGRIETRTCHVENNLALYDGLAGWSHLKSIVMVESKREIDGKITTESRFYLSSLALGPKEFNSLVRRHWSIENCLHWQLDVTFAEDRQRTRSARQRKYQK
ncbi:MAG: ISAs1 family transposase [Cytophagales bacterium]|nr:ISAs1 family transposase [Cytophagales bacterium]